MASPDALVESGNERLRAAAWRLKSATRAAETQPGSVAAQNELKAALGVTEASYEYLIGLFSRLNAADEKQQVEMMRQALAELKKQKQALLSKMSGGAASTGELRRMLPGIVALSDRALTAAQVPPTRRPTPTPAR